MLTSPPLVQFNTRLEVETRDRLLEAAKTAGMTPTEFSRRILREAVSDTSEIRALTKRASGVEYEVSRLRRDLAASVEAILLAIATGSTITPQQVKAFVDEVLRKGP